MLHKERVAGDRAVGLPHIRFQMYVDDHEQFVVTGLEEKVLDVAEKDIWYTMSFSG